jgi:hypothetical protein
MPMLPGTSDDIIRENYLELKRAGKSEKQAWAIALKAANKHKAAERAKKGVTAQPKTQVKIKVG